MCHLRLKREITISGNTAKIYKDAQWNELRVKFYRNGEHLKDADYHCDDLEDAVGTAEHVLYDMKARNTH